MKTNSAHRAMIDVGYSGIVTIPSRIQPHTVWVNGETLYFTNDKDVAKKIYTQAYDEWRAEIDKDGYTESP